MPPTSSPVPRLSSVPSAASTVQTIASRSPLRPLLSSLMERDGRPPRPLLGDVIATTSPPIDQQPATTGQRLGLSVILTTSSSSSSSFPSSSILQVVRCGKQRSKQNWKRENQGEGCRRNLRQFLPSVCCLTVHAIARSSLPSSSAVPVILRPDIVRSFSSVRPSVFLFLVPRSPSCRLNAKPSPAAHSLTRSQHRQSGKGSPRPILVVIPSPPPRHRSTSNRDGRTSARPSARLSLPVW